MRVIYDHAAREVYEQEDPGAQARRMRDERLRQKILAHGKHYAARGDRCFRLMAEPSWQRAWLMDAVPQLECRYIEVDIKHGPRDCVAAPPQRPRGAVSLMMERERKMMMLHAINGAPAHWFKAAPPARIPAPVVDRPVVEKAGRWVHADAYIDRLCERGFKVLGSGAFSTVLAKPGSSRVIKVGRKLDAWPDYVLWANRKGFGGTWAPRLFSFRRHTGHHHSFYVAVIERLDGVVRDVRETNRTMHKAFEALSEFLYRGRSDDDFDAAAEVDAKWPGALRFTILLERWRKQNGAGFDLHASNWMYAGDRLVLTDPVTESRDGTITAPRRVTSHDLQIAA